MLPGTLTSHTSLGQDLHAVVARLAPPKRHSSTCNRNVRESQLRVQKIKAVFKALYHDQQEWEGTRHLADVPSPFDQHGTRCFALHRLTPDTVLVNALRRRLTGFGWVSDLAGRPMIGRSARLNTACVPSTFVDLLLRVIEACNCHNLSCDLALKRQEVSPDSYSHIRCSESNVLTAARNFVQGALHLS